jgi:hypothetical protein
MSTNNTDYESQVQEPTNMMTDTKTLIYANCKLIARVYQFDGIKPLVKGSRVGEPILLLLNTVSFVKRRHNLKKSFSKKGYMAPWT